VRKFSHMRFEPQGYTKNPDIRIAKSLIDYIFRWMGITFLPGYKEASMGVLPGAEPSVGTIAPGSAGGSVRDDEGGDTALQSGGQGSGFGVQAHDIKPRRVPAEGGSVAEKGRASESASSAPSSVGGPATATTIKPQAKKSLAPNSHANAHTNGNGHADASAKNYSAILLARAGVMVKGGDGPNTARSEQFADFQSDAPACDNCGAITVRTGNCYLCHNCGSSMGCS
jgi:ribonucleoside-diphosphate reductase alpha chain